MENLEDIWTIISDADSDLGPMGNLQLIIKQIDADKSIPIKTDEDSPEDEHANVFTWSVKVRVSEGLHEIIVTTKGKRVIHYQLSEKDKETVENLFDNEETITFGIQLFEDTEGKKFRHLHMNAMGLPLKFTNNKDEIVEPKQPSSEESDS